MRSGYVELVNSSGGLRPAGYYSDYWSSFASSIFWSSTGLGAYFLEFSIASVNASAGANPRWYGFSLRCLGSGGRRHSSGYRDRLMALAHWHLVLINYKRLVDIAHYCAHLRILATNMHQTFPYAIKIRLQY